MSDALSLKGSVAGEFSYEGACAGSVRFETNGPQGGDGGHGGYLKVEFKSSYSSMCLDVSIQNIKYDNVAGVSLVFKGDDEIEAAIEFFDFLSQKLGALRASGII